MLRHVWLGSQRKRQWGWPELPGLRMNCDVGEATEGLENEL